VRRREGEKEKPGIRAGRGGKTGPIGSLKKSSGGSVSKSLLRLPGRRGLLDCWNKGMDSLPRSNFPRDTRFKRSGSLRLKGGQGRRALRRERSDRSG